MWIYLAFLAGLGLLRLLELAVSKRNLKRHTGPVRVLAEPLFPWMVLLHSSFFVLLPLEIWWRGFQFEAPLSLAALSVTMLALGLRVWTLRTIGRSWNVRVVYGQDYPIVTDGPYRWIRHPNYLVVFLELLFIPLIAHLYWSALLLTAGNLAVLRFRIRTEEDILAQNPDWRAKMASKPRFFPFLG